MSGEIRKERMFGGDNPEFAAACPLCQEQGNNTKYVGFDLYDHLNSKEHTKSNLAGFLSQEACYQRFWDEYDGE